MKSTRVKEQRVMAVYTNKETLITHLDVVHCHSIVDNHLTVSKVWHYESKYRME
jgi:hypothetical protein